MCSEKKKLACQQNARKSTGPKTPEGKAQSRRNSLKHGLTGAGTVLPPEDLALFKERMHGWTCAERPEGEVETYYVACAVLATVRIDRCARKEFTEIARRRKRAIGAWERRQDKKVVSLAEQLDREPRDAVAGLEGSSRGCRWLLEQWDGLQEALEADGFWTLDQTDRAERLFAYSPGEPGREDDAKIACLRQHLPAVVYGEEPGSEPLSLADVEAARSALTELILAEMERLGQRHNAVLEQQEGPKLADEVNLACFDNSPDGALVRRYESASKLEMHRMMADFNHHRKHGRGSKYADSTAAEPTSTSLLASSLTQEPPPPVDDGVPRGPITPAEAVNQPFTEEAVSPPVLEPSIIDESEWVWIPYEEALKRNLLKPAVREESLIEEPASSPISEEAEVTGEGSPMPANPPVLEPSVIDESEWVRISEDEAEGSPEPGQDTGHALRNEPKPAEPTDAGDSTSGESPGAPQSASGPVSNPPPRAPAPDTGWSFPGVMHWPT
ncbi:MAG TPA: hypothetical protein VGZ22_12230 [Isosphaeraceae bacterium]|nr:hypothetical protein [Isosphaeraceae bacterium]